ncbi:hypothetical protein [Bifidobacterium avesanii]|uniref:Uncharacterized protein n=1 Tax=Bifidobacterium avesanii TaxID=1798157 RepID=A0A7K3TI67_9BIFI|nr:hypothetical protein [Bifidobacterium avesanii]KAB8291029.1 hypothetical protein DSM100685_1291 [Bifidobacterium avesanii]NEG78795.1 hypothetical protein [Bifidobacterium avesanii]
MRQHLLTIRKGVIATFILLFAFGADMALAVGRGTPILAWRSTTVTAEGLTVSKATSLLYSTITVEDGDTNSLRDVSYLFEPRTGEDDAVAMFRSALAGAQRLAWGNVESDPYYNVTYPNSHEEARIIVADCTRATSGHPAYAYGFLNEASVDAEGFIGGGSNSETRWSFAEDLRSASIETPRDGATYHDDYHRLFDAYHDFLLRTYAESRNDAQWNDIGRPRPAS